ncbi:MAG: aldo/keto reductase [Myxococcota bacterium]
MEYRRLGTSGLKVSVLSLGSWVTFGRQVSDVDGQAEACMQAAYERGCNFFDNAEVYAKGESERIMGRVLKKVKWPRERYVISTKFFWGLDDGPNLKNTLNRKYLTQAIDGSLGRLGLDFVDLIFCHRPDPETPIEETVWAMSDIIASGKALYWGTSEWSAADLAEAFAVAEKYGLRKPVMEQPQYHLFHRARVEREYAPIYERHGLGTTTWSPLASGLLTGKYLDGIPEGSRGSLEGYEWLREKLTDEAQLDKVRALKAIADELEVPLAQLAIAWCVKNPRVSTVITGASRVEQVEQNFAALEVVPKLTADVIAKIDAAIA